MNDQLPKQRPTFRIWPIVLFLLLLIASGIGGVWWTIFRQPPPKAPDKMQLQAEKAPHPSDNTSPTRQQGDQQAQRELSLSFEKLGDELLESGQVTKALAQYQKGLEIRQRLAAAADPSDIQAQLDLLASYEKLVEASLHDHQFTEGLGYWQKSLEIRQKLAAADPNDVEAQRDLSERYENFGNACLTNEQFTDAHAAFMKSLVFRQKFAAADPTNARAQYNLSTVYTFLGDASIQREQELAYYQKSLEIIEKMVTAYPADSEPHGHLWIMYDRFGQTEQRWKQFEKAIGWYEKERAKLNALQDEGRPEGHHEHFMEVLDKFIMECKQAMNDPE